MKLLKPFLCTLIVSAALQLNAQTNSTPAWISMKYSNKVSLETALIKIDNKDATFADALKVPDSSVLKVEVYSKKAAQQIVDKDEAKNGLVLVTLHKKHFPNYSAKKDSVVLLLKTETRLFVNMHNLQCSATLPIHNGLNFCNIH